MRLLDRYPKKGTKILLTISGSDTSGSAGIQVGLFTGPASSEPSLTVVSEKADLKTFAAHGCFGTTVITALTAQNTNGVQGVHPCTPEFVANQVRKSSLLVFNLQKKKKWGIGNTKPLFS